MATTQTLDRTLPDIFYEDPEPVEDGMQQAKPLIRIAYLLYEYFADRPDVYIGGGGFVMYNEEDGNERIAPDCYIAFDVDGSAHRRDGELLGMAGGQSSGLRNGDGVAQHGGE